MANITRLVEMVNFQFPGGRWQLFEVCDLSYVPSVIKSCCQDTLTAQWIARLPIIQQRSPATLAAAIISEVLDSVQGDKWKVIDFCSGAGGPTPHIERQMNQDRALAGRKPIPFQLSDIHPNLDAWIAHSSHSEHLSFIPQPVDATNPPFAAISSTTPGNKDAAFERGYTHDGSKVLRLFSLSFHHFDDEGAKKVLKSTMDTSDAVAIIELQDRNIGSLIIMLLEFWLLLLTTIFWFWGDWSHLFLTYTIPVLPFIHCWDGLVSCLRTRTFEEVIDLVDEARGSRGSGVPLKGTSITVRRGDWTFTSYRMLHTWPFGYLNAVIGRKVAFTRLSTSGYHPST